MAPASSAREGAASAFIREESSLLEECRVAI
jgi:hypothetical protein